ncbi:hypothetical protein DFH08DRAFT_826486 [Mycena albidolilacea]|uniref:Uncharacterized protein n=1 Tax=Mycena albidolilacea TaxID=1033008 RepID=A0AAD7E859_9AGAR|nr:hypothetical protein DFH08DRAFT_826486 [Mycena albidolilacea]
MPPPHNTNQARGARRRAFALSDTTSPLAQGQTLDIWHTKLMPSINKRPSQLRLKLGIDWTGSRTGRAWVHPHRKERMGHMRRVSGVWVHAKKTMLLPLGDAALHDVMATLRSRGIAGHHCFHYRPVPRSALDPNNSALHSPIVPNPDTSALRHQIHHKPVDPVLARFFAHGGEAPIQWIVDGVSRGMHPLHLCALRGNAPLPRQYGFPHLFALWGGNPPPPPPHPLFATPTWVPWARPVFDAAAAEGEHMNELLREGRALPAHEYSEDSSPQSLWWWPASIKSLHGEASDEELYLKYIFRLRFPFRPVIHPGRTTQSAKFVHAQTLLHAQLTSSYAVFLLHTRLQEGITVSAAAHAGALATIRAADAAAATKEYSDSLLADDFLAAWIACPTTDVLLWGTDHDPRNAPLAFVSVVTGWANGGSIWGGTWPNSGGAWPNGGGAWGGGWGNEAPMWHKCRRIPRPHGYRRIGVIFLPP